MPTLLRAGRGMVRYAAASQPPSQPLRLYNYENNQFSRLVRAPIYLPCHNSLPLQQMPHNPELFSRAVFTWLPCCCA